MMCSPKYLSIILLLQLVAVAAAEEIEAITLDQIPEDYQLSFESEFINIHRKTIKIVIYSKDERFSAPKYYQPQIIQVYRVQNGIESLISSRRQENGEKMLDAWLSWDMDRCFINVKCRPPRLLDGVRIYELNDDLSVSEKAIFYDKQDLIREQESWQEFIQEYFTVTESATAPSGSTDE